MIELFVVAGIIVLGIVVIRVARRKPENYTIFNSRDTSTEVE